MFKQSTKIRVRYSETDQMGFAYYGNYASWYEVGRVEALRTLGLSYREMEEQGTMLPVLTLNVKYRKPAKYDDEIQVDTIITELPSRKITFDYKLYCDDELINQGNTELVFIDKATGRPTRCPEILLEALSPYFPDKA